MDDKKTKAPERVENKTEMPAEAPSLPKDFYVKLLHLPACKAKGYCDNCGRCER